MAKSRRSADQNDDQNTNGAAGIRYDDFIRQIKPRPDSNEQVILLHGYVGESTAEDKIRLYSDESLAEYVDIALADILYSLPNEDDPLGGSRIWMRQTANVQYNDAAAFTQGAMYNDYVANTYTPEGYGTMAGGTVSLGTAACPIRATSPLLCRPTRFVCPTPASRLVICNVPNSRPVLCPATGPACPRPSWVDGCASALGCTINVTINQTPVINTGRQFYGDYTGGDVYNDYMQNMYEPGYQNFGPASINAANCPVVTPNPSVLIACASQRFTCPSQLTVCFRSINLIQCITRQNLRTICRPCYVTPNYTITPQTPVTITPQTPVTINQGTPAGGGGFANAPYGGYGDYTGGDIYNDYVQNQYMPGYENFGPVGVTPNFQTPNIGVIRTIFNCPPLRSIPVWTCPIRSIQVWQCPITCVNRTIVFTTPITTRISLADCPSLPCPTDITRTVVTDPIPWNQGYGMGYNPYGYGY